MLWTNQQVETAMRILGKYSRVCDALPEIEKAVNRKVTSSSLKHAMKQRNADAPSYYLQRDLVSVELSQAEKDESYRLTFLGANGPESHISLVNDTVRKTENAWVRRLDSDMIEALRTPFPEPIFSKMDDRFKVPKSFFEITYEDINPQKEVTKIMVCPDAHHPYVDKIAWKVFLKAVKAVQPDILVIIGDFVDLLSVSAHPKKASDEKKFAVELAAGNKALDEICALGIKRVIYAFGNHETRFSRYMNEKAPELDGMLLLEEKLKLKERGIEYVPYGEFLRIGQMAFTHDVGRCGVNAARQSLQDFGDNLTFGHSHRAQVVYGGTVEGKTHVCMNVGWLGDYEAIDYRNRPTAKREWQHSFGMIYQDSAGVSYCNLVPIINGRCIVDGKLVDVNK